MADDRSPVNRLLGALINPAVDAVDPDAVIDRVDVEHLVARIDVDGVVARVDIEAVLDRIDFNALLEEIDIDAVLQRVDLDAVLAKADVDALVGRIDMNSLVGRVDIDAVVADVDLNTVLGRVDVNALASQLDLNALLANVDVETLVNRIDMNALVSRIDVDAVVAELDIEAIVARAGIDQIVAEASTGMMTRTLDMGRRQLVGIDHIIFGALDRLMSRPRETVPAGEVSATGRPAGPVSRLLAFLADAALVGALFGAAVSVGIAAINLFSNESLSTEDAGGPAWLVAFMSWWFVYLWGSITIAGRTPGKSLVGLRILALDDQPLSSRRTAVRTLFLPVSFVFAIGLIIGLLRRDRRSLHELISGSKEVIDWGDRHARLPSPLENWVDRHRVGEDGAAGEAGWVKPGTQG